MADDLFTKDDVIYSYGIEQAEEDGILFNITTLNEDWKKGLFSHVTDNLLSKGYYEEKGVRIINLLDLLNQANEIVKNGSNNFKDFDSFFSGEIELPNGTKQKVFIQQNETGKFTIMLPEDY